MQNEVLEFYDVESDTNVRFTVIEQTQLNGETFLLVTDPESEDDGETAYIFRTIEDDGAEIIYEAVDDEKLLDVLSGIFEELLEDTEIQE